MSSLLNQPFIQNACKIPNIHKNVLFAEKESSAKLEHTVIAVNIDGMAGYSGAIKKLRNLRRKNTKHHEQNQHTHTYIQT